MKKKTNKQATYDQAVDYAEFQLKGLRLDFDKKAKDFCYIIQNGGGILNIHILDTLRDMLWLYTAIHTHTYALETLKCRFFGR